MQISFEPGLGACQGLAQNLDGRNRAIVTLRAQILKKIKILKFSKELEIFKRATQQTPFFLWGILEVRIEIFNQD